MKRNYMVKVYIDGLPTTESITVEGSNKALEAYEDTARLYSKARELYQEIYSLANTAESVKSLADGCSINLKNLLEEK